MNRALVSSVGALSLLAAACGTPPTATLPVAAGLVGERPSASEMYAVDWPSSMRADLETGAQSGLAVLSVGRDGLPRVLPRCSLAGAYRDDETAAKVDTVTFDSRTNLSASLPFAAARGVFGGALSSDRAIALTVVIRSRSVAPAFAPNSRDLRGDCAGATHVVTTILRGAFALASLGRQQSLTSAELLGLSASAGTGEATLLARSDGNPGACLGSTTTSDCRSIVKVSLREVAAPADATNTRGAASWNLNVSCEGDEECHRACDQGDMAACVRAGAVDLERGKPDRAERLFHAACDAGVGIGCWMLGTQYDPVVNEGRGGADRALAIRLYSRGCELGALSGCRSLAYFAQKKDPFRLDEEGLVRLASRACMNGDAKTCEVVSGWYYAKGVFLSSNGPSTSARDALQEAIVWERRFCESATEEQLKRSPCRVEAWQSLLLRTKR